jgi:CDP-4-dehydro-6-deoxyglucose reductase
MTFRISLQPGGQSFSADAQTSLLQSALDNELMVPYGCRDGACGACKARVIEGAVDHGRAPLTTLPEHERQAGKTLMCCAHPRSDLVLEVRDVRSVHDIPVRKLPCRVQSLDKLASDVMRLTLRLPPSENFSFLPGQYVDFLLAGGERRSFSVANTPNADNLLELHVRLIPGGKFTGHVFTGMKPRDILRIEGPLGSFHLKDAPEPGVEHPLVFLAGGTGFAPIKAIIEDMIARGIHRDIKLYRGARDLAGLYLHELAASWAQALPGLRYIPVISDEAPDGWNGRHGLVHHAVMADLPDLSHHQVYACGAPAMIDAAKKDFSERCGLPLTSFYADAFTYSAGPQT